MFKNSLPIDDVLETLSATLATHMNVVLEAPPGAGKTTRVPLALVESAWLGGQRILMLEPRRLAARSAAYFMSGMLGEQIGDTVGYRVRGESRVGKRTRIEVVTEGILTRMLSDDSSLESYGLVLFDEFHERSLHADLGLALVLETQTQIRPDLRVLVMSATLDGVAVAQLLGDTNGAAPSVRSDGRAFPVTTHHRPPKIGDRLEQSVARTVREALRADDGDVLVFLPGAAEQRRVAERLRDDDAVHDGTVVLHQLHGSMPLAAQTAAIAPAPRGARKIVLSTSVAETSLTIEGVRVVVDAGYSRLPRYDARAGLTRLETVRVSRASADQRRGRAGRVAPGVCYRMWDAHEEHGLVSRTRPEILEADLSSLALELADAGISDPATLRWLDVPKAGPFAAARELLAQLGALSAGDRTGRITAHGKRMVALPVQPRLAHLMLSASSRGVTRLGAEIAALLEERDFLRGDSGGRVFENAPSDMRLRVEALRRSDGDREGIARIQVLASELAKRMRSDDQHVNRSSNDVGLISTLLALAFPDRVAQRRAGSEPRYLLRGGIGASLPRHDALHDAPFLAIAELDGAPPEYRIARASPLSLNDVLETFSEQCVREDIIEWNEISRSVVARRRTMLGALVLDDAPLRDADATKVHTVLLTALARAGIDTLPWSDAGRRVRERLAFMHAHDTSWPDVSDAALTERMPEWLGPHVEGMRKFTDVERVDWSDALLGELSWDRRRALDELAPTHVDVPSGSRIAIDYSEPTSPVLAVRMQEMFGWTSTPMLFDGRVPLTLHLLSPAHRPVQVTRDLAGFWRNSYFEVRKELRGRYPRHPWPDDPLSAIATRRAKPRGM